MSTAASDPVALAQQRPPAATWRRRRKPATALAAAVPILVIAVFAIRAAAGGGGELSRAASLLSHPRWSLVAVAVLCEGVSYLLFASAQRAVLSGLGHRVAVGWFAALAICAQAMSNFLPAGYLAANLVNFRELRRRRVPARASAWLLATSAALYVGSLALLSIVGLELASDGTTVPPGVRTGSYVVVGLVVAVACAVFVLARRGGAPRARAAVAALARRLPAGAIPAGGQDVALPLRCLPRAFVLFLSSWLADAGCLLAAIGAVGARPAWSALLAAYCAAQLISFVPLTPGGVGLVEGGLTIALVTAGGARPDVLAAVLLYRIISYWSTLPLGLLGYAAVRRSAGAGRARVAREERPGPREANDEGLASGHRQAVLAFEG